MRVLIIRLGAFGDIIHTLPLAADLVAAGHAVSWACEDRWAVLVRNNPAIEQVHCWPRARLREGGLSERVHLLRQLVRSVRAANYDVVIDAQGLAKSHLLALASGARRVAHRRPRARELTWLPPAVRTPVDATHVIDQQRALGLPLTVNVQEAPESSSGLAPRADRPRASGWRFPLPLWTQERERMSAWLRQHHLQRPWMLNVGAGWPTKVWPLQRQDEFAQACVQRQLPLVIVWGSAAERMVAEAVLAAVAVSGAGEHQVVMAPSTTLSELGGLLSAAAVVISGDTGPLHLALALGVPAVGLFGPVPATRNGPRGPRYRCLQAPGAAWERRDVTKGAMDAISAAQVMAAALAIAKPQPSSTACVAPAT